MEAQEEGEPGGGAAYDGDDERDPETFDDTEFYQTLLKEFLEGSNASAGGNWLSVSAACCLSSWVRCGGALHPWSCKCSCCVWQPTWMGTFYHPGRCALPAHAARVRWAPGAPCLAPRLPQRTAGVAC